MRQRVQDDNRVDPSRPRQVLPLKYGLADIPKQAVEKVSKSLRRNIYPKDDENEILKVLNVVRTIVQDALKQDPELKEHLASEVEFFANVKRKGEKIFIDSLRAMAANSDTQGSKAWGGLFNDGTSFSLSLSILIVFSV
jgi:hypothetical protein